MKRWTSLAVIMTAIGWMAMPVFGEISTKDDGNTQIKNVQIGARNASSGWVDIFDSVYTAENSSKNTAEKVTGFVAGTGIGVRKTLHRTASGLMDLCTFWIAKKEPLMTATPKDDTTVNKFPSGSNYTHD